MSALTRFFRNKREQEELDMATGAPQSKLYKGIVTGASIGAFVIVAVVVLAVMGYVKLSPTLFGLLGTLLIVCVIALMMLPWVRLIDKGEFKITSIVFIALLALCAVLWAICLWLIVGIFQKGDAVTEKYVGNTMKFIQIVLAISIQFSVASTIAGYITKCKKDMLALQGLTYLCQIIYDIYITAVIFCVKITVTNKINLDLVSSPIVESKLMLTLFIISVIFSAIASSLMKKLDTKKKLEMVRGGYAQQPVAPVQQPVTPVQPAEPVAQEVPAEPTAPAVETPAEQPKPEDSEPTDKTE